MTLSMAPPGAAVRSPRGLAALWAWVRYSPGLLVAPVFTLGVLFVHLTSTTRDVALWGEVSWSFGYSPVQLAPLAVAVGTWSGTRQRWDQTRELFDSTGRSRFRRAFRTTLADWALVTFGMLAGLLYLAAGAVANATWGGPDLLLLATAIAGIWASLAVGYLLGSLFPHWLTVALSAAVLYAAQGLLLGSDWQFLFPMTEAVRVYNHWPVGLGLLRIAWFVTIGVAALLLTGIRFSSREVLVLCAVVPAAALLGSLLQGTSPLSIPEIPATACAGQSPRVCVHPAYESAVAQLAAEMGAVVRPLADAGHKPVMIRQSVKNPYFDDNTGVLTFNLMTADDRVLSGPALGSVVLGALDPPEGANCERLPPRPAQDGWLARAHVGELMMRQGSSPSARRHTRLVNILQGNWDQLRNCTATPAEVGVR